MCIDRTMIRIPLLSLLLFAGGGSVLNASMEYAQLTWLYRHAEFVFLGKVTAGDPAPDPAPVAQHSRIPPRLLWATVDVRQTWKGQEAKSVRFQSCSSTNPLQAKAGDDVLVMLNTANDRTFCVSARGQGFFTLAENGSTVFVRVPEIDSLCRSRAVQKNVYGANFCLVPLLELKEMLLHRESD